MAKNDAKEEKALENTSLPYFEIPAGIYATFEVDGKENARFKIIYYLPIRLL